MRQIRNVSHKEYFLRGCHDRLNRYPTINLNISRVTINKICVRGAKRERKLLHTRIIDVHANFMSEGEKNCLEFELQHFAMIKLQPEPFSKYSKNATQHKLLIIHSRLRLRKSLKGNNSKIQN